MLHRQLIAGTGMCRIVLEGSSAYTWVLEHEIRKTQQVMIITHEQGILNIGLLGRGRFDLLQFLQNFGSSQNLQCFQNFSIKLFY